MNIITAQPVLIFLIAVALLALVEGIFFNFVEEYKTVAAFFVPLSAIVLGSSIILAIFNVNSFNFFLALLAGMPVGVMAQFAAYQIRRRKDKQLDHLMDNIDTLIKRGRDIGQER